MTSMPRASSLLSTVMRVSTRNFSKPYLRMAWCSRRRESHLAELVCPPAHRDALVSHADVLLAVGCIGDAIDFVFPRLPGGFATLRSMPYGRFGCDAACGLAAEGNGRGAHICK